MGAHSAYPDNQSAVRGCPRGKVAVRDLGQVTKSQAGLQQAASKGLNVEQLRGESGTGASGQEELHALRQLPTPRKQCGHSLVVPLFLELSPCSGDPCPGTTTHNSELSLAFYLSPYFCFGFFLFFF